MSQINVYGAGGGGGGTLDKLSGDLGTATPVAGEIYILGNGVVGGGSGGYFTGSGDELVLAFNNLNLPATNTSKTNGVITFDTVPMIQFYGTSNSFIGYAAGNFTTTGSGNTMLGNAAGAELTSGNNNTGIGSNALYSGSAPGVTSGSQNTALGAVALPAITTGSYNIGIGYFAGSNYASSESGNIILNSFGVASESNVLRIGDGTGTGNQQLHKAFISGINGVTSSNPLMVTINSATDQLGVAAIPSSSISITGDTGGALTGNAFIFTGGSTGLTFDGSGTTETLGGTLAIANGGTDATSFSTSTGIIKYDGTRLVTSSTALIDSSNIQTNTAQPAFFAYLSATQTNATGDNTDALLLFDTVAFDNTSSFDTSTNTYTVPKTGVYSLSMAAYLLGVGTQTMAYAYINVNGSPLIYFMDCNPLALKDNANSVLLASPIIYKFNAGDTINIHCAVLGASKTISFHDAVGGFTFAGYLVC